FKQIPKCFNEIYNIGYAKDAIVSLSHCPPHRSGKTTVQIVNIHWNGGSLIQHDIRKLSDLAIVGISYEQISNPTSQCITIFITKLLYFHLCCLFAGFHSSSRGWITI